jgi:hypothetical protein
MIAVTPGILAFAFAQRWFFKGLMEGCAVDLPGSFGPRSA